MPSSSEIKTLQFLQGVEVTLPISILDDFGKVTLSNNLASQNMTGFSFNITLYREICIDYAIYRRTDSVGEIIERGQLWLTGRPEKVLEADKWSLDQIIKKDEGVDVGVTFDVLSTAGVAQLRASTTNVAGAAHSCVVRYKLMNLAV